MRRALLLPGLLTPVVAWLTGLPQLARQTFLAQVTMRMGVVTDTARMAGGRA